MAVMLLVEKGMHEVAASNELHVLVSDAGSRFGLITNDPLTFDWNAIKTDLTISVATGLAELAITGLVVGPFQDDVAQNVFYKVVGASWTNTSGGAVTITGIALYNGADLYGILVFDDPETIEDDGTFIASVPVGIGQQVQESELENLEAAV